MIGLKKNPATELKDKRSRIDPDHPLIPIYRQCELLGLSRSSLYYKPIGVSQVDQELMHLIDEQYTKTPFYGTRRMREHLKGLGYPVNRKRIARLMHLMGLEALYPKPKLSRKDTEHRVYPYLLRDVDVNGPDQVWGSDITYIRMHRGFVYLTAVMDWYSRYVLSWAVSITLDAHFCTDALEHALRQGRPTIFNTDQGVQFTSEQFRQPLREADVQISMDGKGRAFDNIFVERLWRSVKYEEVFLKDYEDVPSCIEGLRSYFKFYNNERPHQALGYKTPRQVYRGNGSLGDSVPQTPWGLAHSGIKRGQVEKAEFENPAPSSSTRLGARVAPQRCPILRAGKAIVTNALRKE